MAAPPDQRKASRRLSRLRLWSNQRGKVLIVRQVAELVIQARLGIPSWKGCTRHAHRLVVNRTCGLQMQRQARLADRIHAWRQGHHRSTKLIDALGVGEFANAAGPTIRHRLREPAPLPYSFCSKQPDVVMYIRLHVRQSFVQPR